jgi:RNA polymerase sigma-70 factor (ECF subfamily)
MNQRTGARLRADRLVRAQAGDQSAWGEFLREARPWLFARAYAVLRNGPDSDDVVQESLVRLLRHPFDPEKGCLEGYLGTIARRLASDRGRLNRRRPASLGSGEGIEAPPAGDVGDEGAIRNAVRALPPGERAPVELIYFCGKQYEEVSEILGLPLGTVATRVWRAKNRLRRNRELR